MPSYTSKLGLMIPGDNDDLNALRENWDRLDQAFSGILWVPDNTIPDSTILFDGARVAEVPSGRIWRAQKQADGSFTRKWLKYPWLMVATFVQTNFPTGIADRPWGYTQVETQSYNADAGDLVGGRVVIPVRGIYKGKISGLWSQGTGVRSQRLVTNTTDSENTEVIDKSWPSWPAPSNNYHFVKVFNAGDTVCGSYWQNGAASGVTLSARIAITCMRPL